MVEAPRYRALIDENWQLTCHVRVCAPYMLDRLMQVSADHELQLCAGLTRAERHRLISLLSQVAAEQGLPTGVHPGVAATNPDDKP